MSFAGELELFIRARYPILYLVTSEEARALELLGEVAQRRQKKLFEWSCSAGLAPAGLPLQSRQSRNAATRDPLAALDQIIEQVEPALFVLKDFHPFLTRPNHAIVRRLREIALHLRNSHKTVVILSPVLEMPVELEKEVTVLSLPLPAIADLEALLDRISEDLRGAGAGRMELDGPGRERLLQAALGLTLGEAENVFAKILVKTGRLSGDNVDEVFVEKQQIIRKSGLLEYCASAEGFEHVGGLALLKEWLDKRALAFSPGARAYGLSPPRGVLLLGVQGCGKSLCAKAVSARWHLPLLRFDMGRMFNSFVGSSEENVRRAIAVAESVAPAILWVDEIDKAFAGAQGAGAGDNGTSARVFATFLTWLAEKQAPVFVVATANNIAQLPPELLRKGRLDEIFFVDLPGPAERREVLRIHLERRGRDPGLFDLAALVAASEGFSGAEIEEAIHSALFDGFHAGVEITSDHVAASLAEAVPLARTMAEQIAALRAWARGRARNASVPDA